MRTYKKKKAGVKKSEKKVTNSKVSVIKKKRLIKEKEELNKNKKEFLDELFKKCPNFEALDTNVENFFINKKWEIPHARNIMGDFITLLRNEGVRPGTTDLNIIGKKIKDDCFINFQNGDYKCFCCGEDITYNIRDDGKLEPKDVACDHVIPIITMLLTVKTDSISKNLHYIHNKCNGAKTNKTIYETYINLGEKNGIFKCKNDNTKYCRSKFLDILKNLNLRSEDDINYRIKSIDNFKNFINEFKEYIKFFLNDEVTAAQILTKMPLKSKYKSRSNSKSRSKSKSISKLRSMSI